MNNLTRWNPNSEFAALRSMMDRFFEDVQTHWPAEWQRGATPAMDIIDHGDYVELHADLPGVNPDDVDIEFKSGALTISAEINREAQDDDRNYTRRERFSGSYRRTLSVPDTLDVANADANFENGVLVLRIPRKPESKPMRIAIGNGKRGLLGGKSNN
ncbi:MAG: Hsp20/alpha crystallin family protein [Anaerolineales bacterium]